MHWPGGCLACLAAILLSAAGCEKRIPKRELGTVVFEVPRVPGSEKPVELPGETAAPNEQ